MTVPLSATLRHYPGAGFFFVDSLFFGVVGYSAMSANDNISDMEIGGPTNSPQDR